MYPAEKNDRMREGGRGRGVRAPRASEIWKEGKEAKERGEWERKEDEKGEREESSIKPFSGSYRNRGLKHTIWYLPSPPPPPPILFHDFPLYDVLRLYWGYNTQARAFIRVTRACRYIHYVHTRRELWTLKWVTKFAWAKGSWQVREPSIRLALYLLPSGPVLTMLGTPDTYVCTVGGTRRIGGERVSVFSNGDG